MEKVYLEFLGRDGKIKVKWILGIYFFESVASVFTVTLKCFDITGCIVQCPKQIYFFLLSGKIYSVELLSYFQSVFRNTCTYFYLFQH